MYPAPEPTVVVVLVRDNGEVNAKSNVGPGPGARIMVTKSEREFALLTAGVPFDVEVVRPE